MIPMVFSFCPESHETCMVICLSVHECWEMGTFAVAFEAETQEINRMNTWLSFEPVLGPVCQILQWSFLEYILGALSSHIFTYW